MPNLIGELIEDVAARINQRRKETIKEPAIRRAMIRIYKALNMETKCIEKTYEITAGMFSSSVNYIAKPSDFFQVYKFRVDGEDAEIDYIEKELFDESNTDTTFTIEGDYIYFSNVGADSYFTMHYYSLGGTLVNKEDADLATGEENTPDWPSGMEWALLYGAATDLVKDYPMYQNDLVKFMEYKNRLMGLKTGAMRQSVTPNIVGGIRLNVEDDDY